MSKVGNKKSTSGATGPNSNTKKPLQVTDASQLILPDKEDVLKKDSLIRGMLNEEGVFELVDIVLAELSTSDS